MNQGADPLLVPQWPRALGVPRPTGLLRQYARDFQVEECLGFEPEGEGEHVYLWVEKAGLNTTQVARRLAQACGVAQRQVSYSGLKDKQAITRQWFSIHLPGNDETSWEHLSDEHFYVLRQLRHRKKLRRGVHRANHFVLRIRQIEGDSGAVNDALNVIADQGVPNYFGEQRFGRDGGNVQQALDWFLGGAKPSRHLKSLLLSSARSYLFNQLLAERVSAGNWSQVLEGELCMLDGTRSIFAVENPLASDIGQRLATGDIHPTGPLYGRDRGLAPSGQVAELERRILASAPDLINGLNANGVEADRRSLRVIPQNLKWHWTEQDDGRHLDLEFALPSGCFATAVVRELISYQHAPAGAA